MATLLAPMLFSGCVAHAQTDASAAPTAVAPSSTDATAPPATPPAPTTAAAPAAPAPTTSAPDAGYSANVHIGTLGLGADVGKQFTPNFAARLGFNSYSYSHSATETNVSYAGHLDLSSVELLGDLYPGKRGSFHFTVGYVNNSNHLDGTGQASNGIYTINNDTYTAAEVGTFNGHVDFEQNDPYLGIGFGKPSEAGSRIRLIFDLGALFEGSPNVSLTHSGGIATGALLTKLNTDIAAQQNKTQGDLNSFKVYPVVSLGLAVHI
jgi:hypothetical protein